jgi:hypothetical protein
MSENKTSKIKRKRIKDILRAELGNSLMDYKQKLDLPV